jgi:hypothetical protein
MACSPKEVHQYLGEQFANIFRRSRLQAKRFIYLLALATLLLGFSSTVQMDAVGNPKIL